MTDSTRKPENTSRESHVTNPKLKDGFAWQYWRFDKSRALLDAQEKAKAAKRGLWADAEPVPPWEFRRKPSGM